MSSLFGEEWRNNPLINVESEWLNKLLLLAVCETKDLFVFVTSMVLCTNVRLHEVQQSHYHGTWCILYLYPS